MTSVKRIWLTGGLLTLLLAGSGGCQMTSPIIDRENLLPMFGFPAVGGQWEPDVDETDAE